MVTKNADECGSAAPRLDEATLAELYRLHGAHLLRALLRLTNGDHGRAEDILQETLLRAWNNPGAIADGAERARPWLFTVARRIAIDHFRMVAARVQEVADEAPEDHGRVDDPFDAVLEAHDLDVVLDRLPAHHRDVVVELHLKGRSIAQAAETLGVPVGTVKSRNHHAIRALRPILQAAGYDAA